MELGQLMSQLCSTEKKTKTEYSNLYRHETMYILILCLIRKNLKEFKEQSFKLFDIEV
jgi:hypothetical protein